MSRKETVITREELFKLPNYSCSEPTRLSIGKRWRKDVHSYRRDKFGRPVIFPDEIHEWFIGEVLEHPKAETVWVRYSWAVDENHEPHRGTKKCMVSLSTI